jgi:hypothetical protein
MPRGELRTASPNTPPMHIERLPTDLVNFAGHLVDPAKSDEKYTSRSDVVSQLKTNLDFGNPMNRTFRLVPSS